ncbi:MAG: YncE family protein [Gammaproteobacteria bacterium]|nr:YncE family protein [Gammaproteobacteria bacterium]
MVYDLIECSLYSSIEKTPLVARSGPRPRMAQPAANTNWTVENDVGMLDVFSRGSTNEQRIDFTASEDVRTLLRDLGRTEDVKFSPDNRRLAVANRWGDVPILKLPPCTAEEKNVELIPVHTIGSDQTHLLDSPGSVTVSLLGQNRYELLVCNNYANYVTRHILEDAGHLELQSSEILLSKGLGVPDGVAVSSDRRWIAISNHNAHSVFLYENTPELNRHSEPDGILRNLNYPHGLLFAPDDSFMLVADAGAPYVNIYARDGDSWSGMRDPVAALRVMDETTYRRGRKNPQEGGPKGIDVDSGMNVLVTTCDEQVLAFFDLPSMMQRRGLPMDWRKRPCNGGWGGQGIACDACADGNESRGAAESARVKRQWQAWIVYQRVVTTVFKREIARCMMRAINADRTLKRVTVGSIHCARRQARNAPDRSPCFER